MISIKWKGERVELHNNCSNTRRKNYTSTTYKGPSIEESYFLCQVVAKEKKKGKIE